MGDGEGDQRDFRGGVSDVTTMEIVRYLGYRIMTRVEPVGDAYRATSWVVRLDDPTGTVREAGVSVARSEAQAVRDAQIHARLAIEISLEDEALRGS